MVSVMVDDGIPENPIEPGNRAFLVADLLSSLERLDECGLKDVFGRLPASDPGLEESKKLIVAVDQGLDRFR